MWRWSCLKPNNGPFDGTLGPTSRGYFQLVDPAAVDVVDRERDIHTSLDGVPFRGIVDLVDRVPEGLRITDYKTGRPPSQRFLDSRLSQVWLYAAALESVGDDVSDVRLLYLGETGAGRDDRRPTEIARPFDADAVAAAVDEHCDTWGRITEAAATGCFEPTPARCAAGVPTATTVPKASSSTGGGPGWLPDPDCGGRTRPLLQ